MQPSQDAIVTIANSACLDIFINKALPLAPLREASLNIESGHYKEVWNHTRA